MKHTEQRVGVFVDVQNMYYSAKNLYGSKVNFANILESGVASRKLIRAIAYVIRANNPEEQKFFEALSLQGFEVKMKNLQIFGSGMKKGDWDVGIAMDTIRMSNKLDVIILVSGDGDYEPLIEYLQNHGHYVEVMAFGESSSHKIIEQADEFIDLSKDKKKYLLGSNRMGPIRRLINH
ncbi:MAG: NYN domain-containing protein [Parcubacteria group bacterium]